MKKIMPITDLQRQAGQVVSELNASGESVIITQRGRPAAVLVSASRYQQIEEGLERLDELELLEMIARSREAIAGSKTFSHRQVKAHLEKRQKPANARRKRRAR